ncbi:FMN-binding protein [Thalassoglobus polymorphus]|uniref:Electron transport complex subunit RsxG n=1 Tax=Thalassoglobus polymorphus TaxID=2527994 RepID=A0A517QSL4_9PLAN|nr:FMN-binding protein [Thalassoglobus polymorphus]QDT34603.1 Electron transport complex subunit RsxG [Thalassoglobus polymorphus]
MILELLQAKSQHGALLLKDLKLTVQKVSPWRVWGIHSLRVLLFAGIVLTIHLEARSRRSAPTEEFTKQLLLETFDELPAEIEVGAKDSETGLFPIRNDDSEFGYLLTTSPKSDHIIGFSGPTNVAILLNPDLEVQQLEVLWSRDTREHLKEVVSSSKYWDQFLGVSWEELSQKQEVDAVSGATLTSLAIGESIINRLGGEVPSLKFPDPVTLSDVQVLFDEARSIQQNRRFDNGWDVFDEQKKLLGTVLSTSPSADNVVGYQGPTELLIAIDTEGKVKRTYTRNSFDNEPHVSYLDEDWAWPELFQGLTLEEVSQYDLAEQGIEGVSGATFTSMAAARGVIQTAQKNLVPLPETKTQPKSQKSWKPSRADFGTLAVIVSGIVIAMTHLRGIAWLRILYQVILIGYVGFLNGDLLSQAMFVGWTQNGVPWRSAFRLVVLAGIAFVFPVMTKRNIYCSHLCAHGAVQQLVRKRVRYQFHPGKNLKRFLSLVPVGLLSWVILVSMLGLTFSLVDIEAFDAYLFRIAGWSAISIAVGGVIVSLFVPMAYCRFGCPTGATLEYLRRTRRSDRLSPADGIAVGLLLLAQLLYWSPVNFFSWL